MPPAYPRWPSCRRRTIAPNLSHPPQDRRSSWWWHVVSRIPQTDRWRGAMPASVCRPRRNSPRTWRFVSRPSRSRTCTSYISRGRFLPVPRRTVSLPPAVAAVDRPRHSTWRLTRLSRLSEFRERITDGNSSWMKEK